jgi:hypothetical protein
MSYQTSWIETVDCDDELFPPGCILITIRALINRIDRWEFDQTIVESYSLISFEFLIFVADVVSKSWSYICLDIDK